jgi:hypothetical protein
MSVRVFSFAPSNISAKAAVEVFRIQDVAGRVWLRNLAILN